jgi:hypothetical protein
MMFIRANVCEFVCECLQMQLTIPIFNPLKAQSNPIYHLLALLGARAHPILNISRLRVNSF